MKKLAAYTLVELLVVMSIITFIVSGSWAAMRYGLTKSRDLQREKALRMLQTALEAYYSDHGAYPQCSSDKMGTVSAASDSGMDIEFDDVCALEGIADKLWNDTTRYLDEPFKSPLPGLNRTTNAMAYYHSTTSELYALCTVTELPHSNKEKMNYYNPPQGADSNAKGCFCLGPAADAAACQKLTNPLGESNNQ